MSDLENLYASLRRRPRPTPQGRILWDVIEEHIDEGGFELARIARVHDSPSYVLDEIAAELEPRLLTHVEAVRLTGQAGSDRLIAPLLQHLDDDNADAVGFAALVALSDASWESLKPAIYEGSELIFHAVLRAVALHAGSDTDAWIRKLIDTTSPAAASTRVRALRLAVARQLPVESLWASLQSSDEQEVQAAASLLRWMPMAPYARLAQHLTTAGPPMVRLAAAIALLQWHPAAGLQTLHTLQSECEGASAAAMEALALFGGKEDHTPLIAALTDPTRAHSAIRAVGFSGNVAAVDSLLGLMGADDQRASRLAAEAFALITGFNIWDDKNQRQPGLQSGEGDTDTLPATADDNLDDTLDLIALAALPIVDHNAACQFWDGCRGSFSSDVRYLAGDPDLKRAIFRALRHGRMRDHHALATSLAVRSAGRCVVSPRWLARAQRLRLDELVRDSNTRLDNLVAGW